MTYSPKKKGNPFFTIIFYVLSCIFKVFRFAIKIEIAFLSLPKEERKAPIGECFSLIPIDLLRL